MNDWQSARLAVVLSGSPVIDARGALIGWVVSVCTDRLDTDTDTDCGVVIRANGSQGCELFVAPDQIACVADDHVRLSVTVESLTGPRSSAGPG